MNTDRLIESLALNLKPVGRRDAALRLTVALGLGGLLVSTLVALTIGDPFLGARSLDLMVTAVKLGFTLSLALLAGNLLFRSGRPNHDPGQSVGWIAVPVVALAGIAVAALLTAPASGRAALIFGDSWIGCLVSVSAFSVPVFALLILAMRRLAPTDLRLSGTLAGIVSASISGLAFALHCTEPSPVFLLAWYGLPILGAGIVGRLIGPRLLRW